MLPETPQDDTHGELKELLLENQKLLTENNKLLRKIRRDAVIGFVFRILWLAVIFGLPFYLYFYFIEPNMQAIQEQMSLLEQITGSDSWGSFFNKN